MNRESRRWSRQWAWLAAGVAALAAFAAVYRSERTSPADPAVPWYAPGWQYRRKITIHHRKVSGRGGLRNFPALIRIAAGELGGSRAGADVVFTASDGVTKLDYERARFSGQDGLIAWVRLPFLSSADDTALYVYYGNGSSPDQQNAPAVWDSDYLIVAHFADVSRRTARDSTAYKNDGRFHGADVRAAAGKIGGGVALAERYSSVVFAASDSLSNLTRLTWEVWFRPDSRYFGYLGLQSSAGQNANANTLRFLDRALSYRRVWNGRTEVWRGSTMVDLDAWASVAVAFDGSSPANVPAIYLNGLSDDAACTTLFGGDCPPRGALEFPRGDLLLGGSTGVFDEFRYSKTARSGEWIRTEYENQASPHSFYSIGAPEAAPPANPANSPQSGRVGAP